MRSIKRSALDAFAQELHRRVCLDEEADARRVCGIVLSELHSLPKTIRAPHLARIRSVLAKALAFEATSQPAREAYRWASGRLEELVYGLEDS